MAFFCPACGFRGNAAMACPNDRSPLVKAPFGSLLGTSAGNYVLVEELGSGGMGIVLRGIHPAIRTEVAIKVLQASAASDPESRARLVREAQVVNRIGSSAVPKVTDAGLLDDGRPYLVMELVRGQSLQAMLATTPRPPIAQTVQIMTDVLDVLVAAHAANIIHRDLKPANLMLVGTTVHVLDFGVAKLLDANGGAGLTSTGAAIGTPAYMAPEQIRGDAVDARTDLYAASVVLYEMLAGRRPFMGSDFEILTAHTERKPAPPRAWFPEIPIDLQSILMTGLAKAPDLRFRSAAAMKTALSHVAQALG